MSLWTAIQDPLRGKTSLAKVFWVYGLLGSVLVSAIGLVIDSGNVFAMRVYTVFGLLFSVYVTIATYQCAGNCGSKSLAQFVRISAVISLVLLPVVAYLELSGALDLALANLNGEL
jgi:succinate-acetate transporter protein